MERAGSKTAFNLEDLLIKLDIINEVVNQDRHHQDQGRNGRRNCFESMKRALGRASASSCAASGSSMFARARPASDAIRAPAPKSPFLRARRCASNPARNCRRFSSKACSLTPDVVAPHHGCLAVAFEGALLAACLLFALTCFTTTIVGARLRTNFAHNRPAVCRRRYSGRVFDVSLTRSAHPWWLLQGPAVLAYAADHPAGSRDGPLPDVPLLWRSMPPCRISCPLRR